MVKLFILFTAALQESNDLLSEEQQSQLKQLQESKSVDTEVLIPDTVYYNTHLMASFPGQRG